jgi:hypothetical protein
VAVTDKMQHEEAQPFISDDGVATPRSQVIKYSSRPWIILTAFLTVAVLLVSAKLVGISYSSSYENGFLTDFRTHIFISSPDNEDH